MRSNTCYLKNDTLPVPLCDTYCLKQHPSQFLHAVIFCLQNIFFRIKFDDCAKHCFGGDKLSELTPYMIKLKKQHYVSTVDIYLVGITRFEN